MSKTEQMNGNKKWQVSIKLQYDVIGDLEECKINKYQDWIENKR